MAELRQWLHWDVIFQLPSGELGDAHRWFLVEIFVEFDHHIEHWPKKNIDISHKDKGFNIQHVDVSWSIASQKRLVGLCMGFDYLDVTWMPKLTSIYFWHAFQTLMLTPVLIWLLSAYAPLSLAKCQVAWHLAPGFLSKVAIDLEFGHELE